MDALAQHLRFTLRTLRRDLGFTATIVLTLAIGVGVNTAVFGVVRSTLLKPLPYEEPDRLAMVWTNIPDQDVHESPSGYANVQDWKAQNRVFEDLAAFDPTSLTLTDGEWPEQIRAAWISANLFSVLGIAPAIGRAITAEEERARVPVVVLSHDLWQRRFGGSSAALGRTIEIADKPYQVIGVMPNGFAFPGDRQLWLPQTVSDDWDAASVQRGTGSWQVVGRLRPGTSLERARTEMNMIAARLEQAYPSDNVRLRVNVVALHDQVTGSSFRLALWMLFGAVAIVFLIACANVANLFLVRGMNRAQELALRVALGATTHRLIRQALIETMMLSLAAGIVGVLLAVAGLRVFIALAPGNIPRLNEVGIDPAMLTYGIILSLAAGVLLGVAPTLSHAREALYDVLRESRGPTQGTRTHRARTLLIASQFALAIVLVFGASLLIRSLIHARNIDLGFQSENVLMANLSVASPDRRRSFYEQVVSNVQAIPGVRSVGIVGDLIISGAPNAPITIEGRATAEPTVAELRIDAIDGDFFQTMGVPLRSGRPFSRSDGTEAPRVAIINESMARRFWPGETPVGRRFRFGRQPDAPWIEVVGVVGDMRRQGPERAPIPQVFRPYGQTPSRNMILLVRTDRPAPGFATAVRTTIAEIDRSVPLYSLTTVDQAFDRFLMQRRFQTILLGLFSAIALILAAIGIYGLIQYSVAQRTREIGVRMAVGAAAPQVVSMILRQGLTVALPGIALGVIGALWLSDAVSALLFGVTAADFASIVITSGTLLLTTLIACYIPARRAASVDPMTALRYG